MAASMVVDRREGKKAKHTKESVGHKRKSDDDFYTKSATTSDEDDNSVIVAAFRSYQQELDRKHDKHERLVKLSRDVTIQSKRLIFLLHRISSDNTRETILVEADTKMNEISVNLKNIAIELEGEDPYQFLRAYTNGLQEYIEAISFYEYLLNKHILTLEAAQLKLKFKVNNLTEAELDKESSGLLPETNKSEEIQLHLPPLEYVLGLADLTGELMRCCINSIGHEDMDKPFELLTFMRNLYEGFSLCSRSASRDLRQKMDTMRQSLVKVENTCYTLQVRGSEIPKHMLLDAIKVEPQTA
ncbi:translin-associated protein X-like [Antedon mediterranea]|uniref:translin-associated protein X-like n=1 Tax=Antedon mediterranea TaxID=105859 RepID=UPI003AF9B1DE